MELINVNLAETDFDELTTFIGLKITTSNYIPYLCFIQMLDLGKENRFLLRQTINKYPNAVIVIVSNNDKVAKFAWHIDAFYYLRYPLLQNWMKPFKIRLVRKIIIRRDNEKLKMPIKGGVDLWHPDDICVVKGEGNYCKFFFRSQGPKTYTCRIGNIMDRLQDFPYMIKVNQSLVININHLMNILNSEASFIGSPKVTIKLSTTSVKKIKNALLWDEDIKL